MLENINSPKDLRTLTTRDMDSLAEEIREFLITTVAQTGGHLASNLGVVELTLALHKVFNSPEDKIVWDVGHQSYVHKILTGRRGEFHTLRKYDGISGFPKRHESEHDVFDTGHSSTSISAALGLAKARDLSGGINSVIAVIGDGALTGGMAYEALNHAGHSATKLMVVLNDNQMSITKNIGSMSAYLNKIRTEPYYYKFKTNIEQLLYKIPKIGSDMANFAKKSKDGLKHLILPGTLFEELGFKYLGPIDGHDINSLITAFLRAKSLKEPVLLHVCTTKGKGYEYAENRPDRFHGVPTFDVETGMANGKKGKKLSTSQFFGHKLCNMALKDDKLVAITAAMDKGTGLTPFFRDFPDRAFDVDIAEQHAVTFAAGLASGGMKPVVAIYSTFLQRAYDQVLHDVCLQNLPVVFAIDRAGIVGEDGETHHGIYDLSYLSHMPNMSILAPATIKQLGEMLEYAAGHNGPIAIRYPKSLTEDNGNSFEYGKVKVIKKGKSATIIAVGSMLETALAAEGDAEVISLTTVTPLDIKTIEKSAKKTKKVIVLEDNCSHGGAGSLIESALKDFNVVKLGFPVGAIPTHGKNDEIFKEFGLDAKSVSKLL